MVEAFHRLQTILVLTDQRLTVGGAILLRKICFLVRMRT
ncbi:iS1953 family transposase OrfA [Brucella rhizosphaerae]|uniref:IS1953 family transposase OrfA n=1 Tax=Brucella rhizosphaerae TaxID=571254 RepID=A0A256FQ14_9HYPH|nr:iS1953 family transposase OrfA [Brucella rhizosphaerae]